MKQAVPKQFKKKNNKKKTKVIVHRRNNNRYHTYGISKLEMDFAVEYLDKMGLKYIYQFEAKNIKRFYDFAVIVYDDYPFKYEIKEGVKSIIQEGKDKLIGFLIEIDGDFYHSNPKKFNEKELNPMQKHNKFVDKLKNEWALMHNIPLLRIWEDDIRNNRKKVVEIIKEYVKNAKKKAYILENKKIPH